MTTNARLRLVKDLKRFQSEESVGIYAVPQENNLMLWEAVIFGPDDTPWEGGTFKLTMEFSEEYPVKPPNVKFITEMFHPNSINSNLFNI